MPQPEAPKQDRLAYVCNYSGQMAVFYADSGRLYEQQSLLRSASHPGQFEEIKAKPPDVNGDGEIDIAWLRPVIYHYRSLPYDDGRYNPVNSAEFRSVARDYSLASRSARPAAAGARPHTDGF